MKLVLKDLHCIIGEPSCRLHRFGKFVREGFCTWLTPWNICAVQHLNEFDGSWLKSTKKEIWSWSQSCKEQGGGYERVVRSHGQGLIKKVLRDKVEWEGDHEGCGRGLSVRCDDVRVRLASQPAKHHGSTGTPRHFNVFSRGVRKDHRGQPNASHDGVEGKGRLHTRLNKLKYLIWLLPKSLF